jgi:hypothetical protein
MQTRRNRAGQHFSSNFALTTCFANLDILRTRRPSFFWFGVDIYGHIRAKFCCTVLMCVNLCFDTRQIKEKTLFNPGLQSRASQHCSNLEEDAAQSGSGYISRTPLVSYAVD